MRRGASCVLYYMYLYIKKTPAQTGFVFSSSSAARRVDHLHSAYPPHIYIPPLLILAASVAVVRLVI